MGSKSLKKYLYDVQQSIDSIFEYLGSKRHFVIHGYDKVDNVIIWGVISRDLPKLKQQVDKLMQEQTIL